MGRAAPFASNKLGTTASSNATRRRAESCVSLYLRGCRFGFVGRGADEHSQGEVGGAGSHNGATRAAKPSHDGRSVRFRLGLCKYGLACAGTWVFSPFTAKRRGSPCAPWTFVAMWLDAKTTPAVWVVNAEVWSRRRLQRFFWESRTSSWPAAFEGSHWAATAWAERAVAAHVSNCRSRRSISRHGRGGARALAYARPSRGSRSSLGAFPPARMQHTAEHPPQ